MTLLQKVVSLGSKFKSHRRLWVSTVSVVAICCCQQILLVASFRRDEAIYGCIPFDTHHYRGEGVGKSSKQQRKREAEHSAYGLTSPDGVWRRWR